MWDWQGQKEAPGIQGPQIFLFLSVLYKRKTERIGWSWNEGTLPYLFFLEGGWLDLLPGIRECCPLVVIIMVMITIMIVIITSRGCGPC